MIRGSVDVVTTTEVRGWAYGAGYREPVLVQAVLNHEVLGEGQANLHRPDLAAAGLGNGNSGYAIKLYRPIDPLYLPFIVVKVDGGDVELPRAPTLGFTEFFSALYVAHPAVGRSRSVFGGLWTDRTDAAALLRGKVEIGQLFATTATVAQNLIHNGFATVELGNAPAEAAWREALSACVGEVLENATLLEVLRAVLEDQPLAMKAEWLEGDTALTQASTRNISPSPAECLEIIVPLGEGVVLEVVRDSHKLPEFTPHGRSRWTDGQAKPLGTSSFLDRYPLKEGNAVLLGPGTIYQIRCAFGCAAIQVACLPARGRSLAAIGDGTRMEKERPSGVMLLVTD
jgi:hypothetical protein